MPLNLLFKDRRRAAGHRVSMVLMLIGAILFGLQPAVGLERRDRSRDLAQAEWIRTDVEPSAPQATPPAAGGAPGSAPAVSIDALRQGGVEGFAAGTPSPVVLRAAGRGDLRPGWAVALDPGEQLEFELAHEGESDHVAWSAAVPAGKSLERIESIDFHLEGGKLSVSTSGRFRLTAPRQPGNYPFRLKISRRFVQDNRAGASAPDEGVELVVLVRKPFDRKGNGLIGDYPMGIYPNEKGKNVSGFVRQYRNLYTPPKSFILATAEAELLHLSENFRLGDFVPPMDRGKPSYVAVDTRLVEFLEAALAELRPKIGQGGGANPLVILSAFLSPNQLMQFEARGVELTLFTRYQYGDGAALIWDADGDGKMDDLNRDGVVDVEDARQFADLLGEVQRKLGKFGGIGVESAPQLPFMPETPYVDVDMRGVASRW